MFIISILVGICIGLIYGFSFLEQKKRTLLFIDASQPYTFKHRMMIMSFSVLRIALLIALWLYLLRLQMFRFILVLISFLITFWVVILRKKANGERQ